MPTRRTRATALDSTVTCTPTRRPVSRCSRSRRSPSRDRYSTLTRTPTDSERGTGFLAYVGTVATASLPAIAAALALYWLALALGVSVTGGAIGALAFGLATPMWAYATLFWSHALACACLVLAFAACVALGRDGDARRQTLLAGAIGLAGGWAIITDYAVAPAVLIVVALAATTARQSVWTLLTRIAAGAALPLVVLLAYNAASFHDPLHIGYASEVGFHRLKQGVMGVTYPKPDVVWRLLAGRPRGVLLFAPQLVLAPFGLFLLARRRSARPAAIAAGAIVVYFVLYNSGYAYWSGGWSYGPRFLAPALPFACLGLGALWDWARRGLRTVAVALIVIGGVFTFGAVATNPQLPMSVASPFTDVVVPAVQHNAVALGNAVVPRRHTRSSRADASRPRHLEPRPVDGSPGLVERPPARRGLGGRGALVHSGDQSTGTPST